MKKQFISLLAFLPIVALAQPAKVQSAWRNISDYESTYDIASLTKAKEAIDLAVVNEKTKDNTKTWVYNSKIDYYLFREQFKVEEAKLTTIKNATEKNEVTYGNVSAEKLKDAYTSVTKAISLDKDQSYKTETDKILSQLVVEIGNISLGKYNAKKFDEAADFFVISYQAYKTISGAKDTSTLSNALVAAQKLSSKTKLIEVSNFMIQEKLAIAYTYESLCDAQLSTKDTASALQTLKTGRIAFPNDISLMNKETEFYLIQGKQQEAIENLNKAIAQSPKRALLYVVRGNVYDNMANPSKEGAVKPNNYEELVAKAETDYIKASELEPTNFNNWYNLGALYNNWGVFYQTKADDFKKVNAEQKALAEKAQTMFKKAIIQLEKALEINNTESQTMFALRKLYLLTGDSAKAAQMSERMKK